MVEPRKIIEELRVLGVLKAAPQTTVFRASDQEHAREVVLKLLNQVGGQPSEEACDGFIANAEGLRKLGSHGIPEVLDFGFTPEKRAFLVTELLDGQSLEQRMAASEEPPFPVLAGLMRALESVIAGGLTHHNLSPGNIFFIGDDDAPEVRLLGLGTAVFIGAEKGGALTGHSADWDAFAAPELASPSTSGKKPDWRADLYSAALIACRAIGADVQEIGSRRPKVLLPEHLRASLPDPAPLEGFLAMALRRRPSEREVDPAALAAVLETAAGSYDPGAVTPEAAEAEMPPEGSTLVLDELPEAPAPEAGATMVVESLPEPPPPEETGEEAVALEGTVLQAELQFPKSPAAQEAGDQADVSERTILQPDLPIPEPPPAGEPGQAERPAEHPPSSPNDTHPAYTPPAPAVPPPPVKPPAAPEMPRPGALKPPVPAGHLPEPGAVPPPTAKPTAPARTPASPPPTAAKRPLGEVIMTAVEPARTWLMALPRPVLIGGAAAVGVIVLGLLALLLFSSGPEEAPEPQPVVVIEPTAVPVAATPAPEEFAAPAGNPLMAEAQAAVDAGDFGAARSAVEALSQEDEAGLSEDERAQLEEIRGILADAGTDRIARQLRMGLKSGSIKMIRRAVDGLSSVPSSEIRSRAGLSSDIQTGRKVLQAHTLMWRAKRSGDHLQVLERARTLIGLIPKYSGAARLRGEAAAAIEDQARVAAASGEHERALRLLADERSFWAERRGLDRIIAGVRRSAEESRQMAEVLSRAQKALAARTPDAGLKALSGVTPSAAYAAQFAEMKRKLQAEATRLDKNPPKLELAAGSSLRYRKNKPLPIRFEVTDDYRVQSVKVMFRPVGQGAFQERTVTARSDGAYLFEVTPQIHGNNTVEVYVVATDPSGHKGFLGRPRQPLQVVRKKWYQKK